MSKISTDIFSASVKKRHNMPLQADERDRRVDNGGASRSVSLCQIGLRWLSQRRNPGFCPLYFQVV
jgi:hypothetical protein